MTLKEAERLATLETKFDMTVEQVIKPMAFKIEQMHDSWPEITRKVNAHHSLYNDLKEAQCPVQKVMPEERPSDGNGGYLERRKKKSWYRQWKEMSLQKKVSVIVIAVPFLAAYWEWILSQLHKVLDLLETLPK
jgi:hypothetical protein